MFNKKELNNNQLKEQPPSYDPLCFYLSMSHFQNIVHLFFIYGESLSEHKTH